MTILITGGAGFIGSHLAKELHARGEDIILLDSFLDNYSLELKVARQDALLGSTGLEVFRCDIANYQNLTRVLDHLNFDSIIHLAAQPGIRLETSQYSRYISSNIIAFSNILQLAQDRHVTSLIYASSSSVYGNQISSSLREESKDVLPVSFYGATKLANEILARSFVKGTNLLARGLRFFTVYGPWGRPDMAYFRILTSLQDGKPFTLYGTGEILRDFTYIDDVVSSIIQLRHNLTEQPEGSHDIVNVGGGSSESLLALIRITEELTGKTLQIVEGEHDDRDVFKTLADKSYLEKLITPFAFTKLETGMREVVKWGQDSSIASRLGRWVHT